MCSREVTLLSKSKGSNFIDKLKFQYENRYFYFFRTFYVTRYVSNSGVGGGGSSTTHKTILSSLSTQKKNFKFSLNKSFLLDFDGT